MSDLQPHYTYMETPYDEIQTVLGPMLLPPSENRVGRFLEADGTPPTRKVELAWLKKWGKPGTTAVDVGACLGFFTLALARIVGEKGRVVAIEPNIEMAMAAAATLKANGIDTETSHRVMILAKTAAGLKFGLGAILEDPRGPGGHQVIDAGPGGQIYVQPLDRFYGGMIEGPVSVMKIDAEGADVLIMLGALQLIVHERPAILFEWNPEKISSLGHDPWDLRQAIWAVEFAGNYHPARALSGANTWASVGPSLDLVLEPR